MASFDCLIVGAGPVALAMARALKMQGLTYCLCGELPLERPNSPDLRTAALFEGSIRFLNNLGAWDHLKQTSAPLAAIRIIDATEKLLRAPEQLFSSTSIGKEQLGFNVPNPGLIRALRRSLDATDMITKDSQGEINLGTKVTNAEAFPDRVQITLEDGTSRTGLVAVAADGRNSMTRTAATIDVRTWSHDQSALTAHFSHEFSNQGISTEIHTPAGPCTTVPLNVYRSSLVWMERSDRAAKLAELSDHDFTNALEKRLDGLLGPVSHITARRVFPLSSLIANQFASNRIALIGESGHAFPPIGAQGLNLGLRDVASLADYLSEAREKHQDIGAESILNAYSNGRRADVMARTYGVDAFNASLSGGIASLLRGATLHVTKASPDIKRFLIERGMEPIGAWPSLMR